MSFSYIIYLIEFQPGTWVFTMKNLAASTEEIFCTVASYASRSGVDPIVVQSELSGTLVDFKNGEQIMIYAEVKQGENPIIRADVWATVHRPGVAGSTDPFPLNDKGTGRSVVYVHVVKGR